MLQMAAANQASMMRTDADMHSHSEGAVLRSLVIGLTAFLTVVDLFATQAILPSLARHYGVAPAAMGFAVNASTMGMAVAGLAVGFFSQHIDRRTGILVSLALLSVPTVLLASAPNLTVFTGLRICQGLCMASAFTLSLAYLGEHFNAADAGTAFAAYITGNVASNLVGRLVSAAVADHFGLATNFYFFAALNLCGALLVYFTVHRTPAMRDVTPLTESHLDAWLQHLQSPALRASFGIGFCILFAFIGTFTYVNFVLVGSPFMVRLLALNHNDAAGRPNGRRIWNASGVLGRAGACRARFAACSIAQLGCRTGWTRPHWHWDVLRTGNCDGLRRTRCDFEPRCRQWSLFGVILLRWTHRQRSAGSALRPARLGSVRCRYRRGPCSGGHACPSP